nr:MAG TPA: hypothetical protein [Caudoviricetes sp.]
MHKYLLGGWVARPSAFLFLCLHWFLVLFCWLGLLFVVALPVPCILG